MQRCCVATVLVALAWSCCLCNTTLAADASAKFYRGLNLNGPAVVIDDQQWEGKDSANYTCNGKAFENQAVTLKPQTDPQRTKMIRSSRWGGDVSVELTSIPAGTYQVLLYVWEDNDPETYSIFLNDQVVQERFNSAKAGSWNRLGPWRVEPRDGAIRLTARGGAANLSGIEVWSGTGPIPQPESTQFAANPTEDQLAFFEKRIRPLLIERCYECHSAASKEIGGSLLLDSRPAIVKGGDNGSPIVPGDPETSLLMTAVSHKNADLKMPPKQKLPDTEIADLAAWITMRAPDPRTTSTVRPRKTIDVTEARTRWPFAPIVAPPVPAVRDSKWPRGEIDRFIRTAQEAKGLDPVGDAERRVLIRRATFDLIGLPPTPDEVTTFVDDAVDTPSAFAKVVDRLLESPHYGERWGRHWLDVVRYADTAGDNSDYPIPQMIKYRDWVIDAFNRDLPYNQFIRDQLAGDLLESDVDRNQHIIATGYIALARRFGSRVDDYPQHLTIEDTIDNLGRAFLGLSMSCARCHDHKFDPIGTDDYYALYGIFQSTRYPWPGIELEKKQRDLVPLVPSDVVDVATRERKAKLAEFDAELKRLDEEQKSENDDQKKEIDKRIGSTKRQRDDLNNSPLPFETAYAVTEGKRIENARIQVKGNPEKTGDEVPRRFLSVLGGQTLPPDEKSSGRRQLADWIASPDNPLTARVMVNRIWLHHFGQGLVPTPNDFGKQGRPPTHPELLDWLSRRFIESGWSVKTMHRLMMNSRTYQLSSVGWTPSPSSSSELRDGGHATVKPEEGRAERPSYETLDPNNDLLTHFRRRRLEAESLRDTLLVLSGQLESGPGGLHPFPPQKDWNFTQHKPFKEVYASNRRSVYLMTQRIQRHPYLAIFDGPDTSASTSMRGTSTTTLQALYLLNDTFVHDQAKHFAAHLEQAAPITSDRLDLTHQLALGRPITSTERTAAESYLVQVKERLAAANVPAGQHDPLAWQSYMRAIFLLNEFVYVE